MPLVGNLSEFPLPEVLLLIGSRSGRLRIFDIPEYPSAEMDLSEGQAHGLQIDDQFLTDSSHMVAELSLLVEAGDGKFEFLCRPIGPVVRDQPLLISELVMLLVLHVDEKLAMQRALLAPQLFYMLETTAPEMDLDPILHLFYQQSRHLLAGGVRCEDLAEYLGQNENMVRFHLETLHQFGLVTRMETSDAQTLRETMITRQIAQKSSNFKEAVEISDRIRRSGQQLIHTAE